MRPRLTERFWPHLHSEGREPPSRTHGPPSGRLDREGPNRISPCELENTDQVHGDQFCVNLEHVTS